MSAPIDNTAIRNYNLFGETAEVPDVVHCETIHERSQLYGWELRPHRHARLHQVLMLQSGGGSARIEDRTLPLTPPVLLNMPRGFVHGFRFQQGTEGWVITLSADLMDEALHDREGLRQPLSSPRAVQLPPELATLARRILTEYHNRDFARAQILRSQAGALLGLVARAIHADQAPPDPHAETPLLRRFEALVEQHYRQRLPVADYAARLAVSPTHLNRVIRRATGRPASALIAERSLREARRLLIYTTLSAAQIGYELGYSDPAHFSRVFTRGTGLPPRAFRQRIEDGTDAAPGPEV
ncbi:helix-turn-helix domain-containing protein [Pseudodonghicola flavimaris]|uniref:Helix-turn-helix domain-containing protein n=1 Tax=Pseudodonghicola flavimaris TaxID=3050036 RepID=A0ABT7F2A5_9RHOB|nr:helix-turn-helix domain-containing protein [Pseudodonghicola flavimaris]MDK3018733.1 helix-turn-helix domain-containing protein [Pseudodonghicola flavimaris]